MIKKELLEYQKFLKLLGKTKTELEILSRSKEVKYNFIVFAIDMKREKLYDRINKRVDKMIEEGLVDEVINLKEKYSKFPTAMQGLGYKEVVEYLEGKISYVEMIDKIKKESRHYAKRQLTWFRKNKDIIWLDAESGIEKNIEIIQNEIANINKQICKEKDLKSNKLKFFSTIIIVIVLALFITNSTKLIKKPSLTFVVEKGSISYEENGVGYLVRDESVLEDSNEKSGMVQIKYEGDKVAKGDSVFRYYSSNEDD